MTALDLDQKPKLRWPLDIQHFEAQGARYIVLKDPLGLAQNSAVIPAELASLISQFDGNRTLRMILDEGAPRGLNEAILAAVVRGLDELRYLDGAEIRSNVERLRSEYRQQTTRPPALAGRVYPENPEELRQLMAQFRQSTAVTIPQQVQGEICAVMSPHIDYQRGSLTYGTVAAILERVNRPDVIFLFGTAHRGGESLFHLSAKEFVMPGSVVGVAHDSIARILADYGAERCLADELLLRTEHSIELQLPLLMHRFPEGVPPVIPILVGSFHNFIAGGRQPEEEESVKRFVDSLALVVRDLIQRGQKLLFYAAVDLAHVGLHFGDAQRISDHGLEELERDDRALLECIKQGDAAQLFRQLAATQDQRRICGYPALYTMFSVLRRAGIKVQGHCVEYRQAADHASDCVVSFASAYWCALPDPKNG